MRAYHIDRNNSLKENDTINLSQINTYPFFLKEIMERRYPDGLSQHGDKYYAQQANKDTLQDVLTENIYEYERRLYFSHLPSRLQSVFASETIEDALFWKSRIVQKECTIWEIEFHHNQYIKLDAAWLGVNKDELSFLVAAYHAEKYWRTKEHRTCPNLLQRNFKQGVPGKVLLTDITYLTYKNGKRAYLSTIKDAETNEILAYEVSDRITLDIALNP
ncbi:hypothetical protein J2T13_003610 [Paenibacillus sp. DS2015]